MNPLVASKVTRVMMMVMIWVMMLKMTQVTVTMNDGGSKLSFDLLTCSWHPRPSNATLLSVFFNLSTCTLTLMVRRRRKRRWMMVVMMIMRMRRRRRWVGFGIFASEFPDLQYFVVFTLCSS